MEKYRKKTPDIVKAVQYTGDNEDEVRKLIGSLYPLEEILVLVGDTYEPVKKLTIPTLEGDAEIDVGDYVFISGSNQIFIQDSKLFNENYEKYED